MASMLRLQQVEPLPDFQSSNFTTIIEAQLASRPNNAHTIHAVTIIILNLIATTLFSNQTLLDEALIPASQDMLRACIVKMRYAFIKEAHQPCRDDLWAHIQVDRTATDIWWSGFSELYEAFSSPPKTAQHQYAAIPSGVEYFRRSTLDDARYALLVLSTEVQSLELYPDRLPTFQLVEKRGMADVEEEDMLLQYMRWINIEYGAYSAAAIISNSQEFLNYDSDSLEIEETLSTPKDRSEL